MMHSKYSAVKTKMNITVLMVLVLTYLLCVKFIKKHDNCIWQIQQHTDKQVISRLCR